MAAIAAAVVCLAGCGSSTVAAPGPDVGQQESAALPGSVLNAKLTSSDGKPVTLADLRGKVVVISDMMTLCQETCPLDTANVVAAAKRVEQAGLGDKVVFVSITIDPKRDTVSRLAAYRKLYAPAPADWMTLTGSPETLAALWKAFGVYIQKVPDGSPAPTDWLTGKPLTYDLQHSDELFFVDGRGTARFVLEGAPHVGSNAPIPPALLAFMDTKGKQNITNPDPQSWTLDQEMQVLAWLTNTAKLSAT